MKVILAVLFIFFAIVAVGQDHVALTLPLTFLAGVFTALIYKDK